MAIQWFLVVTGDINLAMTCLVMFHSIWAFYKGKAALSAKELVSFKMDRFIPRG